MNAAQPSAARTLVVVLGGSSYPRHPGFDNLRFKRSAEALRAYFEDPAQFGLPADQLLWLFDSPQGPIELNDRIEAFLKEAMERSENDRPQDVIVCFVGHGFFDDDKNYYLATPSFKPGAPEYSYSFRMLQRTIKQRTLQARKYFILDACYSAAAAGEMMAQSAEPILRQIVSEVESDAGADLPQRGTALLCAASKDDQAFAPQASDCTMFAGAMLSVLRDPHERAEALNLHQLHRLITKRIEDEYLDQAVRPEIHVPDQKDGDVGRIPIFTLRRPGANPDGSDVHDALNVASFADSRLLHAVVVSRVGHADGLPGLMQQVGDAWHNFHTGITAAADECRTAWRAEPVPAGLGERALMLAHLAVERAFESEESLCRAVAALCRAEIAIFDLSDWDPGATFLLGVRAVVRRGVTITSIASADGAEFRIGGSFSVPFNLQLLNLAAHSEAQEIEGAGKRPFELLGAKIENGFKELANLPHYLDLPAYDSIRQLGTESGAYRAVPMHERILVLCPFSENYQKKNWPRLERMLPGCARDHIGRSEDRRNVTPPALARLLDLRTPRLVAQTLYESIRLIEMCVIDWTDQRTNVVFEAGVRLAAHPLGAVHVIEEGARARLRRDDPSDAQLLAILRLLDPVSYPIAGLSGDRFEQMVQRFAASVADNSLGKTQAIYATAGAELDRRSQPAALPLANELLRSANILEPDDQESTGVSAVLYHDVNRELVAEASEAAADRRLAAWLFLAHRYTAQEIAADPVRMAQFDLLTLRVKRWARKIKRTDLMDKVNVMAKAVSSQASGREGTGE